MTQETRKSARQIHEESGTSLAWFQFAKLLKDTLPHWEDLRVVAEKTKAAGRAPFDYLLNGIEEQQLLAALPSPRAKKNPEPAAEPAEVSEIKAESVPEVCDTADPEPEPEREIPSTAAVTRALTRAPKVDDVLLLAAGILDTHAKNTRQAVEHLTEALHMFREGWRLKCAEVKTKSDLVDDANTKYLQLDAHNAQLREENERLKKELAARPTQQLWGRRSKPNAGCDR
jgi:hypothetical protein